MTSIRLLITHFLVFSLIVNPSVFAVKSLELQAADILTRVEKESNQISNIINFTRLTDKEKSILKKVGLTEQEVDDIENGKDGSINKAKPKIQKFLSQEKASAQAALNKEVIPGFASSITSMAFASFLGITLITRCRTMPSAVVFSGASAFWIASELANWNGYKLKVENIDTFGTPNAQHAAEIEKIMLKIKRLSNNANLLAKDLKGSLDILRDVESIDDLEKIKGNGEVKKLKALAIEVLSIKENIKILKNNFKVYFDDQYLNYKQVYDSINQVKETTDKKAKNTKIAATGFALASALAFAEHFNLIKANGKCFAKHNNSHFLDLFIDQAYAAKQSEKTLQTGTLASNLDKIGILAGVGLGAAYAGFKMKFLDKILASGMSRGVVFGILAGIAYFSGVKLKEFSDYLKEKTTFVDELRTAISERLHLAEKAAGDIVSIMSYVKLTVIPFIEEHFDKIKLNINDAMEDLPKEQINELKDKIKEEIKNSKEKVKNKIENTVPNTSLLYRLERRFKNYTEVNFIMDKLANSLFPNVSAMKMPSKFQTSCYILTKSFIKEDKACNCSKNNTCLNYKLPQINKSDSKLSSFLSKSANQYMSNINGHLNGYGDTAFKRLDLLTKVNGYYQNVSNQMIVASGVDKEKVSGIIERQVKELIGSIPKDIIKNDPIKASMSRLENPTKYKKQRAIKKLKRLINFKENTTLNTQSANELSSGDNDFYGHDYSQFKPNDIHKKEDLNLFDIISNRYERHFQVN